MHIWCLKCINSLLFSCSRTSLSSWIISRSWYVHTTNAQKQPALLLISHCSLITSPDFSALAQQVRTQESWKNDALGFLYCFSIASGAHQGCALKTHALKHTFMVLRCICYLFQSNPMFCSHFWSWTWCVKNCTGVM